MQSSSSVPPTPADGPGRAVRAHWPGGPEQLVYETVPPPPLGIGDVLVRVRAAGITPTELLWPSTWVDRLGRDRTPVVPGHEVSGVVEALGYGTTGFAVGDEVYGLTDWYRDGSAATHVAVEARNLAAKPRTIDHLQAAAAPMAGLTAWQGLFGHGRLRSGQTVLVHGAAGGVGTVAVQLAAAAGARVIATSRARHADLVVQLGADRVVDVDRQRFEDVAGPVDLVLDLVGGDVAGRSWPLVRGGGTLVTVVGGVRPGPERPDARWVSFVVEPDRPTLVELAHRIDAGQLRPVVGAVFPLADARRAFEAKLPGGPPGKVVLQVPEPAGGKG